MFEFLCILIECGWDLVMTSNSLVLIETYRHNLIGLFRFQLQHFLNASSLKIKLVLLTPLMMSFILF